MTAAIRTCNMELISTLPVVISVIAVALSAYSAYKAQKNEREIHKSLIQNQFFAEYTRRYQELRVKWPNALKEQVDATFYELYFDLCSEEYYLHTKGAIAEDVWKLWEEGIRTAMHKPWFQATWKVRGATYNANGDFYHFMNDIQR